MPRPPKNDVNEQAMVKIENAFWYLLETMRYSEITVLRISQESKTNRNSFYYHYKDIDDMAYHAFMNNANNEVSRVFISTMLTAFMEDRYAATFDPSIFPYSKRIMLCARSDSPYLKQLIKDHLKQVWFASLSIKEERLSAEEKLQIDFIFSGLITVLSSPEVKDSPVFMTRLFHSELGKAIIATMKRIASSQAEG